MLPLKALADAIVDGARIIQSPHVSLTRTNAATGKIEDALFWVINGAVVVHPDRWEMVAFIARRARQMLGIEDAPAPLTP